MDIFTAVSLNNKIISNNSEFDFKNVSTKEILSFRNKIRNQYKAIIVGVNTIKKDNPTLLNTNNDNKRIIIDKYQDLDMNLKIFNIEPQKTYIIALKDNENYKEMIEKKGANFIVANTNEEIVSKIQQISDGKILLEGGAKIISEFMKSSNIDTISVIQFPFIYSKNSLGMFDYLEENYKIELEKSDIIDSQFVYLKYKNN